ncbi:MAG TPA: MgtC/SapB family protein [Planctomycetota bacterium]|jgi:uncharacterized membrane protein (DUF4010 family)
MDQYEPFISLAVALGIGLLIGLQREQSLAAEGVSDKSGLGGVRTYPLFAIAGGLSTILSKQLGAWFVGATFLILLIPLAIAYADDVRTGRDRGLTSKLAFVVTFLLGALSCSDSAIQPHSHKLLVCASIAVVVTSLLSLKRPLHAIAAKISADDAFAAIKFLVLAIIVLPLLPNQFYGPPNLAVLNPFYIGLMIVMIAGIGLVGYALIRIMGPGRGLGLMGLVGGLVSSTVVTLDVSGRARKELNLANACALAVVLASCVMLPRMLIVVSIVYSPLVLHLLIPMACMFVAGLVGALVFYLRSRHNGPQAEEIRFSNPFELHTAIKFGLLFALVLLATKAAAVYLGSSGTYIAAFLSGLTDVDAITLSMTQFARDGILDHRVAANAILLAAAANTILKGAFALSLGGWLYGRKVLAVFAAVLAAGAAGLVASWHL